MTAQLNNLFFSILDIYVLEPCGLRHQFSFLRLGYDGQTNQSLENKHVTDRIQSTIGQGIT
jgi:hypothetical protein